MKGKTRCGWILGAGKRFFWTGIFWVSAVGLAEARPEGLRNAGSEASSEAESVVRSRTEAPDERRPRRKELREGEDSVFLNPRNRYLHRLSSGVRSGYVAPSNRFLAGENIYARPLNWSGSAHLKYSFQSKPGTWEDRVYGSVYQGIPLARALRKLCRERGIASLPVVCSDEPPAVRTPSPASASFVPPAAGLVLASYVLLRLAGKIGAPNK